MAALPGSFIFRLPSEKFAVELVSGVSCETKFVAITSWIAEQSHMKLCYADLPDQYTDMRSAAGLFETYSF